MMDENGEMRSSVDTMAACNLRMREMQNLSNNLNLTQSHQVKCMQPIALPHATSAVLVHASIMAVTTLSLLPLGVLPL